MRDILGSLDDVPCQGDIGWFRLAFRLAASELVSGLEAFGDDLTGCFALEDPLAAGIVGGVEASQELFELLMEVDGDPQHLAADTAIEAFHHAVGLRAAGLVLRCSAPRAAQALAKPGVKQRFNVRACWM